MMNLPRLLGCGLAVVTSACGATEAPRLCVPGASPEAVALYQFLNNLIWVYGPNEVRENVGEYADYFPGHDVVDVLATDVYSKGFAQHDYDSLLALAAGKPIALGEVGPIPPVEILQQQPRWAWFVAWYDLNNVPRNDRAGLKATYDSDRVMNWEELPWVTVRHPTVHYPVIK